MTLYELSAEMMALDILLADAAGEITPELEAAIAAVELATHEKIDAYCRFIRELQGRAQARKAEADRLMGLVHSDTALAGRLKANLHAHMLQRGEKRIQTASFRLTLCNNGGLQPVETRGDPAAVPPEYQRVVIDFDHAAIRSALQAGEELSFAKLCDRGTHVRIG